jgi:DUF971 family protein
MQPVEIHLSEADATLAIRWDDGAATTYHLRYLRGWCPCAKCQGHFSGTYRFIDSPGVRLLDVEPVGAYAIRPVWSDGHSSGMYAFPYLRALADGPPAEGPTDAECAAMGAS